MTPAQKFIAEIFVYCVYPAFKGVAIVMILMLSTMPFWSKFAKGTVNHTGPK